MATEAAEVLPYFSQVHKKLFRLGAQPLGHGVNDTAIGLVRNDAFDFGDIQFATRKTSLAADSIACTAFLKVCLPSICK